MKDSLYPYKRVMNNVYRFLNENTNFTNMTLEENVPPSAMTLAITQLISYP